MPLLDVDTLIQQLLIRASEAHADTVGAWSPGADLDVDSFDHAPFVEHSSLIAQDGNADGKWTVSLTLNVFLDPDNPHPVLSAIYDAIHGWGDPPYARVDGVGAVIDVSDLQAFSPASGVVQMLNKQVRQYQGQFTLLVRFPF